MKTTEERFIEAIDEMPCFLNKVEASILNTHPSDSQKSELFVACTFIYGIMFAYGDNKNKATQIVSEYLQSGRLSYRDSLRLCWFEKVMRYKIPNIPYAKPLPSQDKKFPEPPHA